MATSTSIIKTNRHFLTNFVLFLVINAYQLSSSDAERSHYIYTHQDVLDIADEACFVGIPASPTGPELEEAELALLEIFKDEESVLIGKTDLSNFVWPSGKILKIDANVVHGDYIVAFAKLKLDRECLTTKNIRRTPSHEIYSGSMGVSLLVDFVNEVCITYLDKRGYVSITGLHRDEILQSLFHVENASDVTMGKLAVDHAKYCTSTSSRCNGKTAENHVDHYKITDGENQSHRSDINQIHVCEKIPMPTNYDFFHDYLKISKPVIFTGAIDHWPAISKWTNDFFRKYSDKNVHIKLTPSGEFEGVDFARNFENVESFKIPNEVKEELLFPDLVVVRPAIANMRFSEFLDLMESVSNGTKSGISAYLEYSSIASIVPELKEDIEEMTFFKKMTELKHLNIWLSDGNTLGKLHFDPFDNFLCQISGRKEVVLFGPHNNSRLYEAHIPEAHLAYDKASNSFSKKSLVDSISMVMSPVDIVNPDFERFPKFADAYPMNCTIDEGEVLFMPAFWWHEVQSYPNREQGRNLAVNFWYDPFLTREFPCQDCKLDINPKYRHLL